jgi:hypothetical protein
MIVDNLVIRLVCEGGQLRMVSNSPFQARDLPTVKGLTVRFEVEATEAAFAAVATLLSKLVHGVRKRGAARVKTVREEPPVASSAPALGPDHVERCGEMSVEALVQLFGERYARIQSQESADELAADVQRAAEKCSAVGLAVHMIAWCASPSHRVALLGFLASARAVELNGREWRESLQ